MSVPESGYVRVPTWPALTLEALLPVGASLRFKSIGLPNCRFTFVAVVYILCDEANSGADLPIWTL